MHKKNEGDCMYEESQLNALIRLGDLYSAACGVPRPGFVSEPRSTEEASRILAMIEHVIYGDVAEEDVDNLSPNEEIDRELDREFREIIARRLKAPRIIRKREATSK